jgi:hypothetical protein
MNLFRARETAELRDRLDKETRYPHRKVLVFVLFLRFKVIVLKLYCSLMLFINRCGNCNKILTSNKHQRGMKDRDKERVLLHNVAAHNVNVTGRVCYLT